MKFRDRKDQVEEQLWGLPENIGEAVRRRWRTSLRARTAPRAGAAARTAACGCTSNRGLLYYFLPDAW